MSHKHWKLWFGVGLAIMSASTFGVHYLLFHDSHYIFSYLVLHVAFVPIEVLLATLIIHKLLEVHEKQALMNKMNMAIGVFFSEMGTELLERFITFDKDSGSLKRDLLVDNDWSDGRFAELIKKYASHDHGVEYKKGDICELRNFLADKRNFLLGLLSNPGLMEHDRFTDLLWAVLHLSEELGKRSDLVCVIDTDSAHIANDVMRAYNHLVIGWLSYMMHLKRDYPYLFSLAVRTNPFNDDARAEVS